MSYELGMRTLNLEPTIKIAHTEYCSNVSFIEKVTSLEYGSEYEYGNPDTVCNFKNKMDFDFNWHVTKPFLKGPWTSMGSAVWEGSEVRDADVNCPWPEVESVLECDPVKLYGLCDIDEQAQAYRQEYLELKKNLPNAVIPGGIYRSMISFCIDAFGWDMFLQALAVDSTKFARVLEGIAEVISLHIKAWMKVDIDCFLTHDDIVWSAGPFIQPDWYRKNVFPHFKEYWKIVHDAGKKVLYCADGNFNEFVDDIAEAGADGFIFEPLTDLKYVCAKYGKTHIIIGNADSRTATFENTESIKREIDRCLSIGKCCPGYIFAFGNHLPDNIPLANIEFAMEYFEQNRQR